MTGPSTGSQYLAAVQRVLDEAAKPMTTRELFDEAQRSGLLNGLSGGFDAFGAVLARELRRGSSRFERQGAVIALRRWQK